MVILNIIREKLYWTLDYINGKKVKNAYELIKKIDHLDSGDEFITDYQSKEWHKLSQYASDNTQFYKIYKGKKFKQFPVITKNDIRSDQDKFISRKYEKSSLIKMSTSGSTGTPFVCYQNAEKKRRVNAEIIYYSEKAGYKLGSNLSYIRTVVRQVKKSGLKQFIQNQSLINCGKLSDSGIKEIIRSLQILSQKGDITLLGYGSTYKAICDFALRNNIKKFNKCKVNGIISGSDMLFDKTREKISKLFDNAIVVSRYSNEENGVLGQDEGINNIFTLNEADYIVEIVDEFGNTLPNGVLGRIVVTDLFNYAMPMIRYDTGDMGAIDIIEIGGRKKRCICNFSGRKVDVICNTSGEPLSPYVITNYMWSFPNITQFQIIQKGCNKYLLKLNVPDSFGNTDKVVEVLKSQLGSDAIIDIEKVCEIPVLNSGKRRYIVNEYMK